MSEPRRYRVRHVTRYHYDEVVEACYNRGLLRPRDTETQRLISFELHVSPQPQVISEHLDYFGNHSVYIEARSPATELEVIAESVVEVDRSPVAVADLDQWTVAEAATLAGQADPLTVTDFLLPSATVQLDAAVHAFAEQFLHAELRLGQALIGLNAAIADGFVYAKGVTSVRTTLAELLTVRQGVCQDFAQLMIGCLRSVGLPARYVSGYLETVAPPGRAKLQGADATHAWVSVWTPQGWIDLDPTNNAFTDSAYLVTAWGRDFSDVSPLRGVVFTEASASTLQVEVDVEPV